MFQNCFLSQRAHIFPYKLCSILFHLGKNLLASNSLLESLVFARKAADDMIFGQTPEYVRADAIDMNMYESREELLNACHETVLKEIERMKKSHE